MNYQTMGYGSYLPNSGIYSQPQANYQPNSFQPNLGQQTAQNGQINQQSSGATPIKSVRFATEDEVKGYMPFPNTRELFMDINKSVFYIKSADSLGYSTMEAYEFKKIEPTSTSEKPADKQIDLSEFVRKEDLSNVITGDKLTSELNAVKTELSSKIEELKKSINIKRYLEGEIKDV